MPLSSAYYKPDINEIKIQDAYGGALAIHICTINELSRFESFDCVTLSARYDHGFGWSQLYRFVDKKESKSIEAVCDAANSEVAPKLLHPSVSKNWRVLVTPVIKSNEARFADFYRHMMLDVFHQSQSVAARSLLFSQYGRMFNYKQHQIEGIIKAINDLKLGSFGYLERICFEINSWHKAEALMQFRKGLT